MEFGYFTLSDNHYPNNPRSAGEFMMEIAPAFGGSHVAIRSAQAAP